MSKCYECERNLEKVNVVHYKLVDGYVYYCVYCYNELFDKDLPTDFTEEDGDAFGCYECEKEGKKVLMKDTEEAHQHWLDVHNGEANG